LGQCATGRLRRRLARVYSIQMKGQRKEKYSQLDLPAVKRIATVRVQRTMRKMRLRASVYTGSEEKNHLSQEIRQTAYLSKIGSC
jgi:hypothetical protein